MTLDRKTRLKIVRRAYAMHVTAAAGVADRRLENAFAAVPREDFLGPGPWPVLRWGRGYVASPSPDPVHLYADILVAILPERNLNNGQPSFLAGLIAAAAPKPGEHVVHIGAGVGYYTAILAKLVGRHGRVTAIEYEPALAARLTRNFTAQRNVRAIVGDGTSFDFAPADVILVNAGATHPLDHWLDRLAQGGRLVLPMTATDPGDDGSTRGVVFRIERRDNNFYVQWISLVGIYPCHGMRNSAAERALSAALQSGGSEKVTRLYRHNEVPDSLSWLRGEGWCLAYA
jgi:protein-L-isoaspartate(D-aspartate) O-methyltransferase